MTLWFVFKLSSGRRSQHRRFWQGIKTKAIFMILEMIVVQQHRVERMIHQPDIYETWGVMKQRWFEELMNRALTACPEIIRKEKRQKIHPIQPGPYLLLELCLLSMFVDCHGSDLPLILCLKIDNRYLNMWGGDVPPYCGVDTGLAPWSVPRPHS